MGRPPTIVARRERFLRKQARRTRKAQREHGKRHQMNSFGESPAGVGVDTKQSLRIVVDRNGDTLAVYPQSRSECSAGTWTWAAVDLRLAPGGLGFCIGG